jgi:outer membrane protein OmpA-like peptidoglycan-associated protein
MKKIFIILLLLGSFLETKAQINEEHYVIKNLSINNAYSNFGTSFYGDDKLIFAAPAKRNYIINNVWKGNNQPFLDLYEGTINEEGGLVNVRKFSSKLNTKFHEADVTFTNDKKTVYFSRSNYFEGKYGKDSLGQNRIKMFKATVGPNDEWFNIESMPFNNDNYSVGHPTLSEDQKTLYFVSDMPGTLGKTDVFKVAVNEDGTYGLPMNLGPDVNTIEREMFPFIDGNDELYFASDGKEGLGMLDIYFCKLLPNGTLPSIHLGSNINSEKDDFAFIINKEKREGYFSSNRGLGKGDDDIYYFKEKSPLKVDCNENINVLVKNKTNGKPISNALISIFSNNQVIVENEKTDNLGLFRFKGMCLTNYKIEAKKKFYITTSKNIQTTNKNNNNHNILLELLPDEFIVLREKVMININTIYFDYDKSHIRKDAALELDKVVVIMNKYPQLKVETGSHTDSRGPDSYNFKLSEARANSTVDYIISRGISPDRISGAGYGESQLINKCSNGVKCSSEEHQLNRRTEFVIVNPEVIY